MIEADGAAVFLALKMILKGMGLRCGAEVLGVKLYTVRRWLRTAAEHSGEVNKVLRKDFDVYRAELDELQTFVKKTVSRMEHDSEDKRWTCLSFGPEYKLISAAVQSP